MAKYKETTISITLLDTWERLIKDLKKLELGQNNIDSVDVFFDDDNECLFATEAIDIPLQTGEVLSKINL